MGIGSARVAGPWGALADVAYTAREFGQLGPRFEYRFAVTAVRTGRGWRISGVERLHKRRLDSRVLYGGSGRERRESVKFSWDDDPNRVS